MGRLALLSGKHKVGGTLKQPNSHIRTLWLPDGLFRYATHYNMLIRALQWSLGNHPLSIPLYIWCIWYCVHVFICFRHIVPNHQLLCAKITLPRVRLFPYWNLMLNIPFHQWSSHRYFNAISPRLIFSFIGVLPVNFVCFRSDIVCNAKHITIITFESLLLRMVW